MLGVIAAYGSIAGLFAIAAAFILKLLKKKKKADAESMEAAPQAEPAE